MLYENFDKVLVVDNNNWEYIPATIIGARESIISDGSGRKHKYLLLVDENSKQFSTGGLILPDNKEMRDLLDHLKNVFDAPNKRFWFLVSIRNFDRDMHNLHSVE